MFNKKILIIALLFFVFVSCGSISNSVSAATPLYVNNDTGDDTFDGTSAIRGTGSIGPKKTIQNAINAVNSGGVVNVANGVYNEHITISKSVTINGANRANTIIDGTNNGRIINITGNYMVNINHLTLRNGNTDGAGGAIFINNGTIAINDCIVVNNTATNYGGAILNYGKLNIINSVFTNNRAYEGGGAIENEGTSTTITSCTFTKNTATHGGAIKSWDPLTITGSTFNSNTVDVAGGAVHSVNSTATIKDCSFTNNAADYCGGAIFNGGELAVMIIKGCTFTKNTATNYGGAIRNLKKMTITYSTFTYNTAKNGGAINNDKGSSNDVGSTVMYYNKIIGNSLKEIDMASGSVDARYNWWGLNKNPSSKISAGVKYSPWLITPTVISSNPKNGAKKVSRTKTIAIKFIANLKKSKYWSKITVKKNGKKISFKKWIKGNTLYIKTKTRSKNAYYSVSIPKYALKESTGKLVMNYAFKFKSK